MHHDQKFAIDFLVGDFAMHALFGPFRPIVPVFLSVLFYLAPLQADEPKGPLSGFAVPRQWSDKSGKFKIQARLKFANRDEIQLLKDDDKVVKVPFEKLSEPDQAFVDSFLKAEEALRKSGGLSEGSMDEEEENPFAGGKPSGKSSRSPLGASSSGSTSGALEKRAVNAKGLKPLTITPTKSFWSVPELRAFPEVAFEDQVHATPIAKPFFASMRAMAGGKSGNLVLNSYQQGRSPEENYSRFVVIQAASGDASDVLELPEPWKLMALSPDGSRAAAVRIEGFDKGNDVAIFKVSAQGLEPEFQFTAGGGSWDELHFVAFAPNQTLVTISQKSNLTFWDLTGTPGPKALKRGSTGGSMSALMSPAGEVMAMIMGNTLAMIDTATGKLVGCIRRDLPIAKIAISSDGQSLAIFHAFSIAIYSTKDGQEKKNFAVSEGNTQADVVWVGRHLMVGAIAYDVERGVPVWTYEGNPSARATLGSYLISAFGGDKESTATVFRIPHEEAIRASSSVDPSKIYSIVPGDSVSVQYELNGVAPDQRQAIQQAVESKINELGWRVSPNSSNQMVVKVEQGKQAEAEYYTHNGFGPVPIFAPPGFGSGPPIKVQYVPWNHTISIQSNGRQVFTAQYQRGAPNNLETKDGESTQQAVTRFCQPNADYFKNASIPPHMLKAEYQGGMGKSTMDAQGMR